MNNKGQVLIVFILIIPLLLLGAAYIVDTTYISYHFNKLNGINELVINDAKEKDLTVSQIQEYINKNDSDIQIQTLIVNDDKIEITLRKEIKSLFGNIIGKQSYILTSTKIVEIDLPIY